MQMQRVANAQSWDELIRIESERRAVLEAIASQVPATRNEAASVQRERDTIAEIARVDREIIEQVDAWRNDVARLLGIGKE